jgi:hypothetical protein
MALGLAQPVLEISSKNYPEIQPQKTVFLFNLIILVRNIERVNCVLCDARLKSVGDCCRFQKACVAYGVPDVDLFQTVDLWDRKNIAQVTMTIYAIGRTVS